MAKEQDEELNLATFSDRVVAFSVDIALAVLGYFLTLKLVFPRYPVTINPYSGRWFTLWTVLFLLYQAILTGQGRRSVGKLLLGLQVIKTDGSPLTMAESFIRSASYLVRSVLNIGFMWSLFNPSRQCWHDMAIGSVVVETEPKGANVRLFNRAAAFLCISFFAGMWYWNNVAEPRYYRVMNVAYAKVGLNEIGALQKKYHLRHGHYADNLLTLAPLSSRPLQFMQDMTTLLDVKSGVNIHTSKQGFKIVARAMDDAHTMVVYAGS
jgi:uncharacterized RDD family membrane protein YckC